jgi:hypothetical protein
MSSAVVMFSHDEPWKYENLYRYRMGSAMLLFPGLQLARPAGVSI